MDLDKDSADVNLHFSDKTILSLDLSLRVIIYEQHSIGVKDDNIQPLPTDSWIATYKGEYHSVPLKYKFIHDGNIVGSIHPFLRPRLLPPECKNGMISIEPKYCYSLVRVNQNRGVLNTTIPKPLIKMFDIGERKVKSIE